MADEQGLNRQNVTALLMYLQRALPVVPTTGAEWLAIMPVISALEDVANGKLELELKKTG